MKKLNVFFILALIFYVVVINYRLDVLEKCQKDIDLKVGQIQTKQKEVNEQTDEILCRLIVRTEIIKKQLENLFMRRTDEKRKTDS